MGAYAVLMPQLIILVNAIIFLLISPFNVISKEKSIWINVAVLLAAFFVQIGQLDALSLLQDGTLFNGMLYMDKLGGYFNLLFIFLTLASLLAIRFYFQAECFYKIEIFTILNFALFGMMALGSSAELITVLVALEIVSFCVYTLIGMHTTDEKSNESLLKYFLLGSFIGAFYLLGTAFVFGSVGSTKLLDIANFLSDTGASFSVVVVALLFILATLLFKVASFGFYNWSIDVYYGSPLPFTGFLGSAVKVASFAMLIRVLVFAFEPIMDIWQPIIYVLAILTMFAGNFMSIKQTNLKKLLITSSIVHSGYLLVNIASIKEASITALAPSFFYMFAYTTAVAGTFLVLNALSKADESNLSFDDFKGLAHSRPVLSLALTIFMLSFIGFPYTVGFLGKLHLFSSALENDKAWLAIFGIINTIISVYYYLKVIINIYFFEPTTAFAYKPTFAFRTLVLFFMLLVLLGGFGVISITDITNLIS